MSFSTKYMAEAYLDCLLHCSLKIICYVGVAVTDTSVRAWSLATGVHVTMTDCKVSSIYPLATSDTIVLLNNDTGCVKTWHLEVNLS